MKIFKFLQLIRVHHWCKNLLILLPAFFGGVLIDKSCLHQILFGLSAFCLAASTIYIVNDIRDVEKDRCHPKKCKRPIASGDVSIAQAWVLFAFMIAICVLCFYKVQNIKALMVLLLYLALNFAYSFKLKNIPLVDICILVSGFFLRVLYGSFLSDCRISNWLYLMIITVSFFMALGKRRGELQNDANEKRSVLKFYTQGFLDKNMYMFLSMANVFYSLWACDVHDIKTSNGRFVVFTVPLVILITMRYSFDVEGKSDGDPVDVLLHDKFLLSAVALYAAAMCFLFYTKI